ncbi:MAG: DUF1492 domain-containing protein [Clostridiaceae bacterium]|nr:DUF1492 domain-containing protein [Clostridiaceae bacterium]
MTAKEYLSQAHRLDERINSKIRQLDELNALATKCTPTMTGMPRSGGGSTSRMEDIIVKIITLEDEINQSIDSLVDLKAEMTRAIEAVTDPDEQLVLQYRYFDDCSWEEIGARLSVSNRTVHRIHGSALQNFVVPT